MQIAYETKEFKDTALSIIETANQICRDYARQGYDLTLRQIYYQFVARDLFPDDRKWVQVGAKWVRSADGTKNADPNYDWLGVILADARMTGVMDWNYMTDRTRNLKTWREFANPAACILDAAQGYGIDLWKDQDYRLELWVEKEALAGVVGQIASRWAIPYFSCRGYASLSEMHNAGKRLAEYDEEGQTPVIIYMGDHDPSGVDMPRDIESRLSLFMTNGLGQTPGAYDGEQESLRWIADHEINLNVHIAALTMEQVRQYNPPPNPAKISDSRGAKYIAKFGRESWELDALTPVQLSAIVETAIREYVDMDKFNARVARKRKEREFLIEMANKMETNGDDD